MTYQEVKQLGVVGVALTRCARKNSCDLSLKSELISFGFIFSDHNVLYILLGNDPLFLLGL